ncbi:MAG: CoA transferase [Gemmatimonadetes bacterium]|nr:CoA transferase [Gemmatimonadota bacterium]
MLHGVNVLDLSRVLAGPLCGMTLGDLGANVIKVERPGSGDESRGWGPPFDPRGESAYYLCCNRNKLGITLDLDSGAGLEQLGRLVAGADVVIDNFRRGTLERRGCLPEQLLALYPRLIWCTLTGFGPDSSRPGYDFVVQGEAGWMSITGEPDGAPMKVGVALADVLAAKDATIAILAALAARATGALPPERRRLFVSLYHSAAAALVNVAQNTLVSGQPPRRWGNAHANLVPYQLFAARDRSVVIAVGNDGQWAGLCRVLGLDALARDPAVATNAGRLAERERVVAAISAAVAGRVAAELVSALEQAGVPAGVVRSVPEALTDVDASPLTGVMPLAEGVPRRPPPRLGEHSALVHARGWEAFGSAVSAGA